MKPSWDPRAPRPLLIAATVVALQAVVSAVLSVLELVALDSSRPQVALTVGSFFLVYAGFLAFFAWRLSLLQAWARAPLVMAQLIHIPVAISYWGGDTRAVTVLLLVAAATVLAGIFHPSSVAAIEAAAD